MTKISLEIKGHVAVLTLRNEAKLNALTVSMLGDLEAHLQSIEEDETLRCVILTGSGPKAFCCGADIGEWSTLSSRDFARFWVRRGHRVFDRLARLHLPTIGALNGHTFGGGLELASTCDVRIIAPKATLALPEARVGVVPGWSGSQRLVRLMPEPMVKEMALLGRRIDAKRALASGFVMQIEDDVLDAALSVAEELTALSPRSTELAKSMIHAAQGEDRAAMIEAMASAAIGASDDQREGVEAFQNKRPADFSGK